MLITIVIGAIVSLLVFFFEQWWVAHHPARPNFQARAAFVAKISGWTYFWMGSQRGYLAGQLFDKFVANYDAKPPKYDDSDMPLTQAQAKALVQRYAKGLSDYRPA